MGRPNLEILAFEVDRLIEAEAGNYYGDRRGACDQVNGIFAQVVRNLGYPAILVRGYVRDKGRTHTWVQIGDTYVDLAGAQFGRDQVRVFSVDADPEYHGEQTELPGERTQIYEEDEAIIQQATRTIGDTR